MLVIGIDPGAMKTGIAWVTSSGQARFTTLWAANRIPFRYGTYRNELADFLVQLEEDPVAVAIEQPNETPDPTDGEEGMRSVIRVNCICAVTISEVTRLWPHASLLCWAPKIWRKQHENKEDVAYRMAMKYGLGFKSDDESDALGIADHALMRLLGGDRSVGAIHL